MNYRADIDGLRAIAVLSVVIFHLGVPGFQGGYVGVDIFFVISGFLITSIIKQKVESQNFQLGDFYLRRIRRLIPPLIATIAATFIAAAFVLVPHDMIAFSRSAAAALVSLSNFAFFAESGYWDTASELKPLLHTWSLGVEEQFYLFWPGLVLAILAARRYLSFAAAMGIVTAAGAVLCIWYTYVDQAAAFYLLPFRVFQFAAGAMVISLSQAPAIKKGLASESTATGLLVCGLVCIALSIFTFDANTLFPGWAVLLPTTGAAMVLLSCSKKSSGGNGALSRVLLENPISVWLGRVSYSLYLVHWPIVSLFRYHNGPELTAINQVTLAVATLVATIVLHYGVERNFYQRNQIAPGSARRAVTGIVCCAAVIVFIATSAWKGDGWAWRYPSLSLSAQQIEQGMQDRFRHAGSACKLLGNPESKSCNWKASTQILVIGNSHEADGYNFIKAALAPADTINLIKFGEIRQCNLTEEKATLVAVGKRCQQLLGALFHADMLERLDTVFYAANKPYEGNKQVLLRVLQQLKHLRPDIKIVTLSGYINTKRPCSFYINKTNTTDTCAIPENIRHFSDSPQGEALFNDFRDIETAYIDRVALLCKNRVLQTCLTRTPSGIPAFYDRHHLSLEFSTYSGELFANKRSAELQEIFLK